MINAKYVNSTIEGVVTRTGDTNTSRMELEALVRTAFMAGADKALGITQEIIAGEGELLDIYVQWLEEEKTNG